MNSLSKNIKTYRLKFNYSKKKLSEVTGISRSYLTDLERGNCDNLSVKKLCSLCMAFNITPNDLIPLEMYIEEKKID
ncbi:helix-turn-helix domain-containing protein [uncultured Clostridium sp.]|uniref:helix-turn-helix domain-containing protein n=1 Tax=uncultured Clostridium sp. TaxID=59620 RepID=UPI00262C1B56|nr:helix-turn-helix transcriptional regulator [uncultured Clostridium sp.]